MMPYRASTRAPKIKKTIPERQRFPSEVHLDWLTIFLAAVLGGAAGVIITYIDGALR